MSDTVVIATPHARNDTLEARVRKRLPHVRVIRIRRREELNAEALREVNPRWVFFPHWSWMIPADVYDAFDCVIFHMTDLPYGRGGSPLQNLIVRGHEETVVSALKCEAALDAGPIYMKRPLSLDGTAEEILGRASDVIADMIVDIVEQAPAPAIQQGDVVEFKRRTPADGNLTNAKGIRQIYDWIRMLDADGYPPAFLEMNGMRLTFSNAALHDGAVEAKVRITMMGEDE